MAELSYLKREQWKAERQGKKMWNTKRHGEKKEKI
jgi:hypothetical protein